MSGSTTSTKPVAVSQRELVLASLLRGVGNSATGKKSGAQSSNDKSK
jgi:hypothetical protein